jgi:hypothetical protein
MEEVKGCKCVEILTLWPALQPSVTGRWTGIQYNKSAYSVDSRDLRNGFESDLAGKSEEL